MTADTIASDKPVARRSYAKTALRKRQIVEAATSVFATRGYNGGSLREIAGQLEVGMTSLMHHFPDKIVLLQAVLEHADETGNGPFHENCRRYGVRFGVLDLVQRNFDHPELLRMLAILGAECSSPDHPGHPWFVERYARSRADYTAKVRYDQARGLIPEHHDPAVVAELIVSVWEGAQLQWLIDPSRKSMLHVMEAFFDDLGASALP